MSRKPTKTTDNSTDGATEAKRGANKKKATAATTVHEVITVPRDAIVFFYGPPFAGKTALCKRLMLKFNSKKCLVTLDGSTAAALNSSNAETKRLVFDSLVKSIRKCEPLTVVDGPSRANSALIDEIVDTIKQHFSYRPLLLIEVMPSEQIYSELCQMANEGGDEALYDAKESYSQFAEFSGTNHTKAYSDVSERLIEDPERVEFCVA